MNNLYNQLKEIEEFNQLTNQELQELVLSKKILGEIIQVVDLVIMEKDSIKTGDSFSMIHGHMEHQLTYQFQCTKRVLYLAVIY